MTELRDRLEGLLRSWDAYETGRGAPPVIDYDCIPTERTVVPSSDRLSVHAALTAIRDEARSAGDLMTAERADAHRAYAGALLGAPADGPGVLRLSGSGGTRGRRRRRVRP